MSIILNILGYFFSPLPTGPFNYMWLLIAFTIIGFACSIFLRVVIKKKKDDKIFKKHFRSLPGKLQNLAICEAIYIFARSQKMPYLSMRFLNYIILGAALYIILKYLQLYFKDYPEIAKKHKEQLALNKYLPRKGGKKI